MPKKPGGSKGIYTYDVCHRLHLVFTRRNVRLWRGHKGALGTPSEWRYVYQRIKARWCLQTGFHNYCDRLLFHLFGHLFSFSNLGDYLSRMEVPLALFQHHQKESGFLAGGARGGLEEKWRRNFYFSARRLISNICVMIGGRVLLARSLWLLVVVRMKESSFDRKVKVNPDTPLSQVVHVFSYLSSFCTFYHQYFISSRLAWKCSSKEIYTKFRNTAFICSKEIIFIIKNIRIFLGGLSSLGAFLVI